MKNPGWTTLSAVHSTRVHLLTATLIAIVAFYASHAEARKADPLFRSNDLLEITIHGPFSTINRERDKEKRYPGSRLGFVNEDGTNIDLDIDLQVRGNFRLDKKVCRFAPLRLYFNKDQTGDTLFAKQKKLKLVTHCKDSSNKHQQYVLQEYLIYRMFNVLSDISFRVRLVHVTYVDTDKKDAAQSYYGFLIENKKRLAHRLDMKGVDLHKVRVDDHDPQHLNLVSVFQFFVGNTDWSVIEGETDEPCCHNAKLVGNDQSVYFGVPYDFDFSGLVNATYAYPNPKFPIKNVRTRYYRGFCQPDEILQTTLAMFREHKDSMFSSVTGLAQLDERVRVKGLKYLAGFYDVIDNPKRLDRMLVKSCRG
jgi:hypothetical protein